MDGSNRLAELLISGVVNEKVPETVADEKKSAYKLHRVVRYKRLNIKRFRVVGFYPREKDA